MQEIWKQTKYDNIEASTLGNIRFIDTKEPLKIYGLDAENNYLAIWVDNKSKRIHRIIAETFIPNPDNKPCVDHINGNKHDNNVRNLRWATYTENNNNPITKAKTKATRSTIEYKEKMHKALSGEHNGANTHPEKNIFNNGFSSIYWKGKHYYNNGEIEIRATECPEGFTKGRLKGCFGRKI